MRPLLPFSILLLCVVRISTASPIWLYPDNALTPGAFDPHVTQTTIDHTICQSGYTATVRGVTASMKRQVVEAYLKAHPTWPRCKPVGTVDCEIDHLVSLELGGMDQAVGGPVTSNLWPQPYSTPGARQKDVVETHLKHEICSHAISLADAQKIITSDWFAYYHKIQSGTCACSEPRP